MRYSKPATRKTSKPPDPRKPASERSTPWTGIAPRLGRPAARSGPAQRTGRSRRRAAVPRKPPALTPTRLAAADIHVRSTQHPSRTPHRRVVFMRPARTRPRSLCRSDVSRDLHIASNIRSFATDVAPTKSRVPSQSPTGAADSADRSPSQNSRNDPRETGRGGIAESRPWVSAAPSQGRTP
jgi:hypothetical protein